LPILDLDENKKYFAALELFNILDYAFDLFGK